MSHRDEPTAIRQGEELETGRIEELLKSSIPGLTGKLSMMQFRSGHSNLTYLLKIGRTELVLRRPPFGTKAKTAHDMLREYRMLKALKPVFPYCPEPVLFSDDVSVMGCPFYVMQRIRGIILHRDLPDGLALRPEQAATLCDRLLDVHVELHSVDYREIGLADYGKPEGYVKRQVDGWSNRYRTARTADAPDFEPEMAWLQEKMPPESPAPGIVHNDFRLDNVVLDEEDPMTIVGVLDWEMATVGDPLMDLGNSLAYWIEAEDPPEMQLLRLMPTQIEGMYSRSKIVQEYFRKTGRPEEPFDFYYCFGLFRLAAIAQQIYYRYYHGQTRDERFAMLIHAVRVLEGAAKRVIARSGL